MGKTNLRMESASLSRASMTSGWPGASFSTTTAFSNAASLTMPTKTFLVKYGRWSFTSRM